MRMMLMRVEIVLVRLVKVGELKVGSNGNGIYDIGTKILGAMITVYTILGQKDWEQ